MRQKYSVLVGIATSAALLFVATLYYPGGSQYDKKAIGFDWKNNYLSNLFADKAVNGSDNVARFWAIPGMLLLCFSFALFFIEFSKKIASTRDANIIKYGGVGAMFFAFLAVTPYHDTALIIASTMGLVSLFYSSVYVFRSGLHILKILSIACLLISYTCNYVYFTSTYLAFLPILQKIMLAILTSWVLSLHYFTTATDFQKKAANTVEDL